MILYMSRGEFDKLCFETNNGYPLVTYSNTIGHVATFNSIITKKAFFGYKKVACISIPIVVTTPKMYYGKGD